MTSYGQMTPTKRRALALYADPSIEIADICSELRISRQRLAQIRKEFGVPTLARRCGPALKTLERLERIRRRMKGIQRKLANGVAVTKIAADLRVRPEILRTALHDAGIDVSRQTIPKKEIDRWVRLYVTRELSSIEVARLVGHPQSTVYNKLEARGVLRTSKETMKKYHERARRGAVVRNAPAR